MAAENPIPRNPRPYEVGVSFGTALPIIAHVPLADAFLAQTDDFRAVYDLDGRPTAMWVGSRWDVSKDITPLREAVSTYLQGLQPKYPKPEKGPDPSMRLLDWVFVNSVASAVKTRLPKIKSDAFDQNPYLLGLPNCNVVDLRTGEVRVMRREDYLTKRIYKMPVDEPTPRFDRFLEEITLRDAALANYLLRLAAMCLTAEPVQKLFFLWGSGRNGKGVYIRTLTSILGEGGGGFAVSLNPDQITTNRLNDAMKRVYASMEGKRLVTVNESVGGNLNIAMLKQMSGGDSLSGAKMRQDAKDFKPTHKLLLPTNDRPKLPADPAFRGRVHFVPFRASFAGREDPNLEPTLRREIGGIVHRLIRLAPDVLLNGLQAPACVLDETRDLFDELDLTRQFIEARLIEDPDGHVVAAAMQQAVNEWLTQLDGATGVVISDGHEARAILTELQRRYRYKRTNKYRAYLGVKIVD